MRILGPLIILAVVGGIAYLLARRTRRREDKPEINKHPERLEQMLDPTDDA